MNRRRFLKTSAAMAAITLPMPTWAAPSAAFPFTKTFKTILGHDMAYVDEGTGDPVVFFHGNPTSSYLWRNIIPAVTPTHRAIAADMIGMGDSAKPDLDYTYADHAAHLHGLLDALDLQNATLVLHDWGGALGFRWARLNAHRVAGIAYMETLPRPMSMTEWPEAVRGLFNALRSEAGDDMILNKNVFVERILPGSVLRDLTEDEMAEYRRPFSEAGEDRRPTLTWPRQIPLDGTPPESTAIIAENWEWLRAWDGPKLLVDAEPGAIMKGAVLEDLRGLANQQEVTVAGSHFIQEDSGAEIGAAIVNWKAETKNT